MFVRLLLAALAFAALLAACNTGTTTIEDMQRNQRMQTMTAA